jgi:hypothetical protein
MNGIQGIEVATDAKAFGFRDGDIVPRNGLGDFFHPAERHPGSNRDLLNRHGTNMFRGKHPPRKEPNECRGMVAQQFPGGG